MVLRLWGGRWIASCRTDAGEPAVTMPGTPLPGAALSRIRVMMLIGPTVRD
ncbi:hypothetical protein ACVIHH_001548 [Bradyrhizobium sp. USDA 4518]